MTSKPIVKESAISAIMTANPVLHSEFKYQRFVIQRSRSGGFWIFLAILMVAPALFVSLGYTIGLLLNLFPIVEWSQLQSTWHANIMLMLVVANVSMYTVVTLVSMALANSSIKREKDKHTWSLLRLTYVTSGQIVVGKWWASLRALNGDHIMVIFLRVGLLAMTCAIFIPSYHASIGTNAPYALYFLLITPLILLQGLLDAALSVILGIVGALPDDAFQTIGGFAVMFIRLITSIMLIIWFGALLIGLHQSLGQALMLAIAGLIVTFVILLVTGLVGRSLLARI